MRPPEALAKVGLQHLLDAGLLHLRRGQRAGLEALESGLERRFPLASAAKNDTNGYGRLRHRPTFANYLAVGIFNSLPKHATTPVPKPCTNSRAISVGIETGKGLDAYLCYSLFVSFRFGWKAPPRARR